MTKFTTRVELHKADDDDYQLLHEEMEKEGFSRTIISDDGTEYHLPPAEYNLISNQTASEVRAAADRAATKTKRKHAILVTPSTGRYWSGLEKVK